jgi:cell division protein FtsQ
MRRPGRPAGTGKGRRHPWRAAFFGLGAIALVAGVTWALLGPSLLVVRTVRTTGSAVPRSAVVKAADVRMGTPLIRIDTAAVARHVERITQVQVARVSLSWPDGLVIWTRRRTPMFALRVAGGYDVLDSYGVVLRRSVRPPRGLLPILLRTGQPGPLVPAASMRRDGAVLAAGAVIRTLPAWLKGRIAQVRAGGPADVTFVLRDGHVVRWGAPARATAKAAEVAILLRTKAKYYDVSDPVSVVTGRQASAPSSPAVPNPSPSHG